jgi:hypothetical protein
MPEPKSVLKKVGSQKRQKIMTDRYFLRWRVMQIYWSCRYMFHEEKQVRLIARFNHFGTGL